MNILICLLLFFYLISTYIPLVINEGMGVKEGFDIPKPKAEEYVKNGKHYTAEGNLYFVGQKEGYSEELTLFFKNQPALCTPFFRIRFCLEDVVEKVCENGITLCYDSKINADWNKEAYKNLPLKVRKDLNCSSAGHHGIMVYTDKVNGQATKFKVKASIDEHIYVFPVPKGKKCFDLNMGSNYSLATTITDVNRKKLIFVGSPPADFKIDQPSSLFYKNKLTMNLWMLFIDFMPYFLPTMAYKPRKLQFTGGGKKCRMTATFDAESIHICRREKELIGTCESENLGSADLDCRVELRASQSVEEGTEKQTAKTVTDSKSETKGTSKKEGSTDSSEKMLGGELKVGAEVEGKLFGFGTKYTAELTIKGELRWTTSTSTEDETSSSNTKIHETSETKSLTETYKEVDEKGKTVELKIHRTDGGSVNLYQPSYTCGGRTYRYHKIIAEGDKEHATAPQSTVVYEMRKETEERNMNNTVSGTSGKDAENSDQDNTKEDDAKKKKPKRGL